MAKRLPRDFFAKPTVDVARQLLGCVLVRVEKTSGQSRRTSGIITETEAYCGEEDLGCHAKAGRTKRTEVMYGPAGHAYIYFTYGNHWMLCVVTQGENEPHAILIRAMQPMEGKDMIARRRKGQPESKWTDGPGKLTKALRLDGKFNGADLTSSKAIIFIEAGQPIPNNQVTIGPRIGLYTVPEPWKSKPWRYVANLPKHIEEKK